MRTLMDLLESGGAQIVATWVDFMDQIPARLVELIVELIVYAELMTRSIAA